MASKVLWRPHQTKKKKKNYTFVQSYELLSSLNLGEFLLRYITMCCFVFSICVCLPFPRTYWWAQGVKTTLYISFIQLKLSPSSCFQTEGHSSTGCRSVMVALNVVIVPFCVWPADRHGPMMYRVSNMGRYEWFQGFRVLLWLSACVLGSASGTLYNMTRQGAS